MTDVHYMHNNEEDTRRTYSVDELVDGASGIVVATKDGDSWACEFEGPASFKADEQEACCQAVKEHLEPILTPTSRSRSSRTRDQGGTPTDDPSR